MNLKEKIKQLNNEVYLEYNLPSEIIIGALKYFSENTFDSFFYTEINNNYKKGNFTFKHNHTAFHNKLVISEVLLEEAFNRTKRLNESLVLCSEYYWHLKNNILTPYKYEIIKKE